jgi:hypothetical protein
VTDAVSCRCDALRSGTRFRWDKHFDYGLLREKPRPDGGYSLRFEGWINSDHGLWHHIEFNPFTASMSEISEDLAQQLMKEKGAGDLYGPAEDERYWRETNARHDRDPEELPPVEPFRSLTKAGRARYVQARREGLSFDDALALGRGHFMLGPVPPALMPDDDGDDASDADDR